MNPFDMRGPAFLVFYVFASLLGLIVLYLDSRGYFSSSPRFPSGDARRHLRDPYLLAFLRGGVQETLQTVAFSLNKRRLLTDAGTKLVATRSREALQAVRHPLELAMLTRCPSTRSTEELLRDSGLKSEVDSYVQPLRDSGLIADGAELSRRLPAFITIAGALLALSAIKIYLAIQRGHYNVGFLIILTAFVLFAGITIFRRRRTNAGERALSDQQTLFTRLKGRVHRLAADGATDEAVLVAAAFGLEALPESVYPFAANLRRQVESSLSNSSTSCGSSSGSSCSSSGGSSCGGGGGGCGGCGGG